MAEFPALPLFTDAFISDTTHLNAAQTGAYIMLLMAAWRSSDCMLPDNDKVLARMARMEGRTWASNRYVIMSFWKKSENQKWYQPRLSDERKYVVDIRHKNSIAGKCSSLKRKNRHLTVVPTKEAPDFNPHTLPTPISIDTAIFYPAEKAKETYYEGKVIKLNYRDYFDWWQTTMSFLKTEDEWYHMLNDRDDWLAKQSDGIKGKWFISTKKYFQKIAKEMT